MESVFLKANRRLRFQKCPPTENSQSVATIVKRRLFINRQGGE